MAVLITSDADKLPSEVRLLLDSSASLPPGTQFFEEKFTIRGAGKALVLGLLLVLLGGLALPLGFALLIDSGGRTGVQADFAVLGVGVVLLFGAYFMLASLRGRMRLRALQRRGLVTRHGIFLDADRLISHSLFDTTIIPRSDFTGLTDGSVHYVFNGVNDVNDVNDVIGTKSGGAGNGVEKTFALPVELVGRERATLEDAIRAWATHR